MKKEKGKLHLVSLHQRGKAFWVSFAFLMIVSALAVNVGFAEGPIYAYTADGARLGMKRYTPAGDELIHRHHQPILLLPGILTNMNEFLCHTPDGDQAEAFYSAMELPSELATWAQNDPYVHADPMKYYSLAHALWAMGYDVWLGNYRGVGRGEYASQSGTLAITMDLWAALDTPAIIDKVLDTVNQEQDDIGAPEFKLIIGGHSTGGLASYLYLSGAYISNVERIIAELGGYNPHTRVSKTLAEARNDSIAGFLGIDPAGPPPLPASIMDRLISWAVLQVDYVFPFDSFAEEHLTDPNIHFENGAPYTIEGLFGMIDSAAEYIDLLAYLQMWNTENTNPYVEDFYVRYAISNLYVRILAQYTDWGIHGTVREHYRNGSGNEDRIIPPEPGGILDDLLDFQPHIKNMTVPAYCVFSDSDSLVSSATMNEVILEGKTFNNFDTLFGQDPGVRYDAEHGITGELPNSAHIDIIINEQSPVLVYPDIADWVALIGQ